MDELVRSRENPHVKRLCALLTQKKQRDESGLFVLEGARLCLDGHEAGLQIETLLLSPEAAARYPGIQQLAAKVKTVWLDDTLCARIGDTKSPQGVFAVVPKPRQGFEIKPDGRYLMLAELQDPGNLGTILRTACALGLDGALLSGCPDLHSPKVVRAAMGAVWRMPVAHFAEPMAMIEHARSVGVTVYAAALSGDAVPLGKAEFGDGCAVLVGNEGAGLLDALVSACDKAVIIPMGHCVDSLNAAAAAAVLIWEMTK